MISIKSWKYAMLTINIANIFGFYTFRIERKGNSHILIQHGSRRTILITLFLTLTNLVTIAFLFYTAFLHSNDIDGTTQIFFVGMISILVYSVGLQFWHLRFANEIPALIQSFLQFNRKSRKI